MIEKQQGDDLNEARPGPLEKVIANGKFILGNLVYKKSKYGGKFLLTDVAFFDIFGASGEWIGEFPSGTLLATRSGFSETLGET